jgi:putative ABC transport system permease protein
MSRWVDSAFRRLAALIVRGPDARFILGDLDETLERDRGASPWRARRKYAANALGSALSVGRTRLGSSLRALPTLGFSWLDLKLGLRMLVKYPGLTLVAVFALSLGIPASLVPMHFLGIFDGTLPFDEGERIVGIRHYRTDELAESPGSAHEYLAWREGLTSFEAIGAARADRFNVIAEDGSVRAYRGALMTASAFGIARVPPLLGRPLIESDEQPGAPDVVVVGYAAWRTMLDGDPRPVGRVLRIGGRPHVVVGVMPEGYLFPVREQLWLPLRGAELAYAPGTGPDLWIFGRLADGVTEKRAQGELTAFDTGLKAEFPAVYDRVRAEVVPFITGLTGNPAQFWWLIAPMQLGTLLLLAVACGNVGTLIFARTMARSGEVAVRTALGASRARIVSQLFAESLVLALLATGLGLLMADFAADRFSRLYMGDSEGMPFWIDLGLSRRIVVLALGLAVFSAVIAGVLPALKATGRGIHNSMQRASAFRSTIGFGRVTATLVVTEIALGVMCLFLGSVVLRMSLWQASSTIELRSEEFLTATLSLSELAATTDAERDESARRTRIAAVQSELVRRLEAEPGVLGVAITGTLPGQGHGSEVIEIEGEASRAEASLQWVARARVDVGYFDGLGSPVLQGRHFAASDLASSSDEGSSVVIVNTTFVDRVLRGGNPIGRRLRFAARGDQPASPWYEIVGVVGRLGTIDMADDAGLYEPVAPGALRSPRMAIRLAGDPSAFTPRLRQLAAAVDPAAILDDPMPLDQVVSADTPFLLWAVLGLAVVAGIAVVLSVAGLYALMSFTVSQRTREIGVRTALGASAARIMSVVAMRAALQLATGVAIGTGLIAAVVLWDPFGTPDPSLTPLRGWPISLTAAAAFIVVVAIVACIAPTVRGLRIKPMDAMRT